MRLFDHSTYSCVDVVLLLLYIYIIVHCTLYIIIVHFVCKKWKNRPQQNQRRSQATQSKLRRIEVVAVIYSQTLFEQFTYLSGPTI